MYWLHWLFNYVAPPLLFLLLWKREWKLVKAVANPRLAVLVAVVLAGLSVYGIVTYGDKNTAALLMYEWRFSSLLAWTVLMAAQIFMYARTKLPSVVTFCVSIAGVMLASVVYELPWYFVSGTWVFLLIYPKWMFSTALFLFFLYEAKWKPNKLFYLSLIIYIAFSAVYAVDAKLGLPYFIKGENYTEIMPYYLKRLSVFPMFLSFPYGLKNCGEFA